MWVKNNTIKETRISYILCNIQAKIRFTWKSDRPIIVVQYWEQTQSYQIISNNWTIPFLGTKSIAIKNRDQEIIHTWEEMKTFPQKGLQKSLQVKWIGALYKEALQSVNNQTNHTKSQSLTKTANIYTTGSSVLEGLARNNNVTLTGVKLTQLGAVRRTKCFQVDINFKLSFQIEQKYFWSENII